MTTYKYFISYSHLTPEGFGFGNCDCDILKKIRNVQDIQAIARSIETDEITNVVILNFQLLETDA